MTKTVRFDASTPLSGIVDYVDAIKKRPLGRCDELVPLLSEGHPLYSNRMANEVLKLRAYAMAAMEYTGLPEAAMPFVRESLESSHHPYTVAAAACALRGTGSSEPEILETLLNAIFNIWQSDRPVSFAEYSVIWPQLEVSSGLTEIFQTLEHFGPDAHCMLPALEQLARDPDKFSDAVYGSLLRCIDVIRQNPGDNTTQVDSTPLLSVPEEVGRHSLQRIWPPLNLNLEDQDATHLQWKDFFGWKPTLIGFFYTRCGNPNKCTRTISNLVRIQEKIKNMGLEGLVRVCAISYDAQFDTPAALRSYGDARKFRFNNDYRMFRVSEGFDQLVELMELEVSFEARQVTSHRIELFVLDGFGEVAHSFVRLQSEPDKVIDALAALVQVDSAK